MEIYVRGLIPIIQIYVCEGTHTTIEEAERRALRKEAIEHKLNGTGYRTIDTIAREVLEIKETRRAGPNIQSIKK